MLIDTESPCSFSRMGHAEEKKPCHYHRLPRTVGTSSHAYSRYLSPCHADLIAPELELIALGFASICARA